MLTASINLRTLAAVSLCSSKEETRYYLGGVCVEITPRAVIYVATDGYRLLCAREDLADGAEDNTLVGTWIIPTKSCTALKPIKASRWGDCLPATLSGSGLDLTLSTGDNSHGFKAIDGTFPDWRRVMPHNGYGVLEKERDNGAATVTFNPAFLSDFAKAAKLMDLDCKAPHVVNNGGSPATVWFGEREDVFGVVMSMRSRDMRDRNPPAWASNAPASVETEEPELKAAE